MKAPLGEFAARIVRNNEVDEFIKGLIQEQGVDPAKIRDAATAAEKDRNQVPKKPWDA